MSSAIIRIVLRYGAAALVAHGWLTADDGAALAVDPDIQMLIGALVAGAAEVWYWLAKRLGWTT